MNRPSIAHVDADLLVLGAGAAGLVGALRAARAGLRVALVDPHWSHANTLAVSGGLFPAAGSAMQRAAGIHDSPDRWLADLRAFAGDSVREPIVESIAHALPEVAAFLDECLATGVAFLPDVPAPGHSVPRFHSVRAASGRRLHDALRTAALSAPCVQVLRDAALGSNVREAGGSVRIELEPGPGGSGCTTVSAAQCLLAGGGFGANAVMLGEFLPDMAGALHGGPATNDGSTIALGRGWGAALAGMDGFQGQGHSNPNGRTRLGMSLPSHGAILLNRDGLRFVREDVGPSALAAHVLAQPGGVALEVFDAAAEAAMGNHSAYGEARAAGAIVAADDTDALAAACGVPVDALKASIEHARACAAGGRADPLGRATFVRPLTAPWRASWVTGALAHTQGGLSTDGEGRVLDAGSRPLSGLYAAGGCAAGLSGRGGDGYLPGNGLAQSFGLAFMAAGAAIRAVHG